MSEERPRRPWRIVRGTTRTVVWVAFALTLALGFLLRTALGHRVVLGWGLDQVRSRVAGTLEVGDIRSATLFKGARLVDVRLATPQGRPFFEADSLEAQWDLFGLLSGAVAFTDVFVWAPRFTYERDPASSTLDRWIGPGTDPGPALAPDSAGREPRGDARPSGEGGAGIALEFRDITLMGGAATLRFALDDDGAEGSGGILRTVDEGSGRQLAIDATDLHIRAPLVQIGEETRIELREVDGELFVLEEPFAVQGLRGQVRVQPGQTVVALQAVGLPGLRSNGSVVVTTPDEGDPVTHLAFHLERVDTRHWQWVAGGVLPDLQGEARLRGRIGPAGTRIALTEVDAETEGGEVRGQGAVIVGGETRLENVDVVLERVDLGVLDRWLENPLPVQGTITGPLRLDGPLTALSTEGRLALRHRLAGGEVRRTDADFEGVVQAGTSLGVRGFSVRLDPLEWGLIEPFAPSVRLGGQGRLTGRATGSLDEGLRFDADAVHTTPGDSVTSRVLVDGSVRRSAEGVLVVDIQGDLSPLDLDGVLAGFPDLQVGGRLAGTFRARGPMNDLDVQAELETRGGRLDVDVRADVMDVGSSYTAEARADAFRLSSILTRLPDPTVLSGTVRVDGSGTSLATLAGRGEAALGRSTVGRVKVDSMQLLARVEDGRLLVDTVRVRAEDLDLAGRGDLAVDSARPAGRVELALSADSLAGIRSLLRGDTVVVADGLSVLDREVLLLQGVDPDTLPQASEVLAEGRLRARASLEGSIENFDIQGDAVVSGVRWGGSTLRGARLDFTARGLPGLAGRVDAELQMDSVQVGGRSFTRGLLDLDFTRPRGRAVIELGRGNDEDYRLVGGFEVDSLGGRVELDSMRVRIDSLAYRTAHPSRITWGDSLFGLDSLTVVGEGSDPVRIAAAGTLTRSGEEDFKLDVQELRLERLLRILQLEELELSGAVDFSATVRGSARAPTLRSQVTARDLRTATVAVDRLEGEVDYADQRLTVDVDTWRDDIRIARVEGHWPFEFGLAGAMGVPEEGDVDLTAVLDSVPAAFVLSILEDLEEVEGTVGGQVRMSGTPRALEPSGRLTVSDGAWTVGALGVRQSDVQGTFDLTPDRNVQVSVQARSGGTLEIDGTVALDTISNPGLDLQLALDDFSAVSRRDIEGAVSGALTLRGRYQAPIIEGDLQVVRGNIYLEEFQRNLGVVDLSDPRFFAVDTTVIRGQSVLADTRNPFLDNLLVIIDLAVERNTWIRSPDLNVEMQGDLSLTFDRRQRDVVFVGELQAVRGQYNLYSRTFEVDEGTVEFVGIPGINPNLDIQAETRVRRRDGDPLTITANVEGTLVEPRVSLSSEEAAVAESDLLSYLVFGQSSSQTTTGNVGQVASQAGTAAAAALGGTLTSSLAALAQGTGFLDYLSISQAVDATTVGNTSTLGAFSGTQVEVGRYFGGGDFFGALVLRPLAGIGSRGSVLGGARIEWQASDQYHLEVFAEDQFLRVGSVGFQDLGINSFLIYGLSLYREWGY